MTIFCLCFIDCHFYKLSWYLYHWILYRNTGLGISPEGWRCVLCAILSKDWAFCFCCDWLILWVLQFIKAEWILSHHQLVEGVLLWSPFNYWFFLVIYFCLPELGSHFKLTTSIGLLSQCLSFRCKLSSSGPFLTDTMHHPLSLQTFILKKQCFLGCPNAKDIEILFDGNVALVFYWMEELAFISRPHLSIPETMDHSIFACIICILFI